MVAKYVPAGSERGVEIDLEAVVHIGERAYYERLNKGFVKYDAVLYELVAPEGNKPPKGGEKKSDNPVAMLQQGMKLFLRLQHQLEVIDYQRANFIHADLSPEGMKKAMKEHGDDEITIVRRRQLTHSWIFFSRRPHSAHDVAAGSSPSTVHESKTGTEPPYGSQGEYVRY